MINELSQALYGEDETTVAEIRSWFEIPDLVWLVALREGRIVGYADLTDNGLEHTRFWIDLRVPPSEHDAATAAALLEAMEKQAAEGALPGASVRLGVPSPYELAARVAGDRGYELFRHSLQMRIEFGAELPAPQLPEGVSLRSFVPGNDEESVYEAHQEAFADGFENVRWPYDNWFQWAFPESFDPTLWFVAEDGDEVAGVCICRAEGNAGPDFGWVNVLGVRRPWRRRGLGRALLLHAFGEFRRRGKRGVGLGVDGLNPTGAVQLYEQAGMFVARRYDQYQKPLAT